MLILITILKALAAALLVVLVYAARCDFIASTHAHKLSDRDIRLAELIILGLGWGAIAFLVLT